MRWFCSTESVIALLLVDMRSKVKMFEWFLDVAEIFSQTTKVVSWRLRQDLCKSSGRSKFRAKNWGRTHARALALDFTYWWMFGNFILTLALWNESRTVMSCLIEDESMYELQRCFSKLWNLCPPKIILTLTVCLRVQTMTVNRSYTWNESELRVTYLLPNVWHILF